MFLFTWLWLTSHGMLSRYIEILLPIFRLTPSIDIIVPPDLAGIYVNIEILLPIFRLTPSIDIIVHPDLAGIYVNIGPNRIK